MGHHQLNAYGTTRTSQLAAVMAEAPPGGVAVLLEMLGSELFVISSTVFVLSARTCITTVPPLRLNTLACTEMRSPALYPSSAVLHSR
jgi:hypothetical protein